MSERPSIREMTGVALNNHSMQVSLIKRTSADFVAALGGVEKLASNLWRIKYAGDEHLLYATVELFAKHVWRRPGKPKRHIYQLCKMALEEWSVDMCVTCNGNGVIGGRERVEHKLLDCHPCKGKGSILKGAHKVEHLCQRCCGKGKITEAVKIPAEKHRVCQVCNGAGVYVRKDAERAAAMGLKGISERIQVGQIGDEPMFMFIRYTPEQEFTELWWAKYSKILGVLQRLDRKTNAIVKEAIN